jgi:tripartite-type tricarboxylate transporter receptor subunit TctC
MTSEVVARAVAGTVRNFLGEGFSRRRQGNMKWLLVFIVVTSLALFSPVGAAEKSFYEGKTVTILVGYRPGGGAGTYAVLISKHLGKHIPGNPTVVVQYMPSAAGIVATNHLYNRAAPDGLTIGAVMMSHMYPAQITKSEGVQFDISKWQYLGNASTSNDLFVTRAESGFGTLESLKQAKQPPRMGYEDAGSGQHLFSLAVESGLGAKFNHIFGYKGGGDIDLALERKELDGRVANLNTYLAQKPHWIREGGFVKVLVQEGAVETGGKIIRDPRMPQVPTATELFPSRKVKQLLDFGSIGNILAKVYVAPPKTPDDRVKILRQAFLNTLQDPALIAEAQKLRIDVTAMGAKEVEEMVKQALVVDPEALEYLKTLRKE